MIQNKHREKQCKIDKYKKELKKNPTKAEKHLYKHLKSNKIKFSFQKAFYNEKLACIVDFYLNRFGARLVVEIDGGYHTSTLQQRKDAYRTKWLKEQRGCRVLRFTNEEVLSNVNACIEKIKFHLDQTRTPRINNSPEAIEYREKRALWREFKKTKGKKKFKDPKFAKILVQAPPEPPAPDWLPWR